MNPTANHSTPGAIVVGGYINGLNVARSLAAHRIRVSLVRTHAADIAHLSRAVSESVTLADSEPESLLTLLRSRFVEWKGRVLLPTTDASAEALARNQDELSQHYRLAAPSHKASQILLRKELTYQAARKVGVPVPHCYGPASEDTAADRSLHFPVVLKPSNSCVLVDRLGKKVLAVHNAAQFLEALATLRDYGLEAEVYDLVPGPDENFFNYLVYMDRHGRPVAELAIQKFRKSPPFFGVGRVVTTDVPAPIAAELRDLTIRLLREIGWRGPASAELKLDPRDGRLRLMEINGRNSLMMAAALPAGVNFPLLAWRDAAEQELSTVRPNGWKGVWINLHADLLYALLYHRTEGLSWREFLAPYRQPKAFAVWSLRDPLPFAAQWGRTVWETFRIPFDRRHRSKIGRSVQRGAATRVDEQPVKSAAD